MWIPKIVWKTTEERIAVLEAKIKEQQIQLNSIFKYIEQQNMKKSGGTKNFHPYKELENQ